MRALGLLLASGRRLLENWRSPVCEWAAERRAKETDSSGGKPNETDQNMIGFLAYNSKKVLLESL
jgi:hypothetical protein